MAEKNNTGKKMSKEDFILTLASFIKGECNIGVPGLTNHLDEISINKKHLCHIMKSILGGVQIESVDELKQLISNIKASNDKISISEKNKKCFKLADQLEKEIRDYKLYDVLFESNNSTDENEELLNFVNSVWYIKDIREWKSRVRDRLEYGEIGPNSWEKWYILNVAKKQGIEDNVIKKWNQLIDDAYKLCCSCNKDKKRYDICNCLLFEMQNNDESKTLKDDLQIALYEFPDAYNPPDNLSDDYFLIKSGIIKNLDEFIDIMQSCIKNKVYLYCDLGQFRNEIIERLVGKKQFFNMIENATVKQIKKIIDIDVKMNKISELVYHTSVWDNMFDDFLSSSRNSKAVENIIACAVKDKESFLRMFPNVSFKLLDFHRNNLQIGVEIFEKFLSKCGVFDLLPCGTLVDWTNALSICLECCSDDMKNNNKKIDLGHIFPDVAVFCENFVSLFEDFESDNLETFFNFVFDNIDKIKLDSKLVSDFLFGCVYNTRPFDKELRYRMNNFTDVLRIEQEAATKNRQKNKLTKIAIVINAILKKQDLQYEGKSIQERFEAECKKTGINVSCDQDDVFFVRGKIYLVDKDTRIAKFNDGIIFLEYVYQNIITEKGQRYAALLGNYICKENNFNIYNYVASDTIDNYYFFTICLLLAVLKNHDNAKLKIQNLYVNTIKSKFRWLCFYLYRFFYFTLFFRVEANISEFYSTIKLNDNKNVTSKNQTESNGIFLMPKSEIATDKMEQK